MNRRELLRAFIGVVPMGAAKVGLEDNKAWKSYRWGCLPVKPKGLDEATIDKFMNGLMKLEKELGVMLWGGDPNQLTKWDHNAVNWED